MKILIAEDDPVSRTLMLEILSSAQAGYDILPTNDGVEAWTTLQSHPDVKLAIIDLAMPGLSGLDWLDKVRGDPRFSKLPVIVCTASADRATVSSVAARGVSNFLVKPFNRTTVLEKVWQICKPVNTALPVVRDLAAARQKFEIDRDTHRELIAHFVRVADMWATDARRATDFPRVRSLGIRAGVLKQMLNDLGAAAVGGRFQEAEEMLAPYRTKPLSTEMSACVRKAQLLGEKIQPEIDRLREMLDTIA